MFSTSHALHVAPPIVPGLFRTDIPITSPPFFFCCSFALFGGALLLDTAGDVVEVQVMQRDFLFFLCVYFFLFQMVDYDFVLTSSVLQAIRWRPANLFCTAANLFCTADHSWHSTCGLALSFLPPVEWKKGAASHMYLCVILYVYTCIYTYICCVYISIFSGKMVLPHICTYV